MNDSDKRLSRTGLVVLFMVSIMTCSNGRYGSVSKVYGESPVMVCVQQFGTVHQTADVNPIHPKSILSQLPEPAYNSRKFRQIGFGGGFQPPVRTLHPIAHVDQHSTMTTGQNSKSSGIDTVDGRSALAVFEQIESLPYPVNARKEYADFTLTAYAVSPRDTGKVPGDAQYGITYCGTRAKVGRTVAVDPEVIPIGTILWIEGVGYRIAEDTGGAVKGHHIDVLMKNDEAALQFGVKRHVRIRTIYKGDIPR